jgi:hypothetical protein
VSPGARQLAAKAGRVFRLDPQCAGEHEFEGQYTPFVPERPSERGKPGEHESPCPCMCDCVYYWPPPPPPPRRRRFPRRDVALEAADASLGWLDDRRAGLPGLFAPDFSAGFAAAEEFVGTIAVHRSGASPTLDALLGGQAQGLGMSAGSDLELGVMRPALTLSSLATAGIPGPFALAPPEMPGGPSLRVALRAEDVVRPEGEEA